MINPDYIVKRYSKAKVMADNPTRIGIVGGVHFYEHPRLGDEVGLIAVDGELCGLTDFYDLPDLQELS